MGLRSPNNTRRKLTVKHGGFFNEAVLSLYVSQVIERVSVVRT